MIESPTSSTRILNRPALVVAASMAVVAMAVVLADLAYRLRGGLDAAPQSPWKSDEDGSVAELVGYGVLAVAALIALRLAASHSGWPVFSVWAGVIAFVGLDDLLTIHERVGGALSPVLGTRLGLDGQAWGELLAWGAAAVVAVAALSIGHRRSVAVARRASWHVVGAMAVLGLAAVGVDMVVAATEDSLGGTLGYGIAMAETAGELFGCGALLAVMVGIATGPGRSPQRVVEPARGRLERPARV